MQQLQHPNFMSKIMPLYMVVILVMLCGCNINKVVPVAPSSATISFAVDWSRINLTAERPLSVTYWLYPRDGGQVQAIDVLTGQTNSLQLKEGTYDMIAYNNSGLTNLVTGGHGVYADHVGYLPIEIVDNESDLVKQADWLHLLTGLSVRSIDVTAAVPLTVTIKPQTITKVYKVNLSVNSPAEIKGGTASLSGVKSKINFNTSVVTSDSPVSVLFPIKPTTTRGMTEFVGIAYVLGVLTQTEDPNVTNVVKVTLDYVDPLRPSLEAEFDVSKDVSGKPDNSFDFNVVVDVVNEQPKITVTVVSYDPVEGGDIVIEPTD